MSLPAADRLARCLDHLAAESHRLADAHERVRQSEESYPLRLGTLLGHTSITMERLAHFVAAAREALHDMVCSEDAPCDRCESAATADAQRELGEATS